MSDTASLTIVERCERLEREQRRWRRLAGAGGLGLLAVALMGQAGPTGRTVPPVLEAERFVLRDTAGRARAELAMDGERSVALRFKDADNMPRLTVGTENGAALLVVNEQGGRVRAGLVTLPHGAPALTLYDAAGKARAELTLNREGAPALAFYDRDGFGTFSTPKQ
jgi:hypothetical protein